MPEDNEPEDNKTDAIGGNLLREGRVFPKDTVFTIGHSTMPIERFIALLKIYGIKTLVDIRTIPRSRHNPQFNEAELAASLEDHQIKYVHMAALGGLRRPRKDSINLGWKNESFRGYADYMQTEPFKTALESLETMSRHRRIAIMCAEAVPWRCHRSLVADALTARGVPVVDIFAENSYRLHKLAQFAKLEGAEISYPAEEQ